MPALIDEADVAGEADVQPRRKRIVATPTGKERLNVGEATLVAGLQLCAVSDAIEIDLQFLVDCFAGFSCETSLVRRRDDLLQTERCKDTQDDDRIFPNKLAPAMQRLW